VAEMGLAGRNEISVLPVVLWKKDGKSRQANSVKRGTRSKYSLEAVTFSMLVPTGSLHRLWNAGVLVEFEKTE
jgi:hypothetical protein